MSYPNQTVFSCYDDPKDLLTVESSNTGHVLFEMSGLPDQYIALSHGQVTELRDWLNDWLGEGES